jgi:hypothetical protein
VIRQLDTDEARAFRRMIEATDLTGSGIRCLCCRTTYESLPLFIAHPCERVNGRHLRAVA